MLRFGLQRLGGSGIATPANVVKPRDSRMVVFSEEQVEILGVALAEHCAELAMLDVPLEQLRRECVLELLDVRFDSGSVGILLRRIDFAFMTESGETAEVVIVFRKPERLVGEVIPPCAQVSLRRTVYFKKRDSRRISRISGRS